MTAAGGRVDVVVAVADHADLAEVAGALRDAGMTLAEILDGIAVITGTVDGRSLPVLSTIPGVIEVEPVRGFRIPPPDSAVP